MSNNLLYYGHNGKICCKVNKNINLSNLCKNYVKEIYNKIFKQIVQKLNVQSDIHNSITHK